jgi:RHS repeat-associated protein
VSASIDATTATVTGNFEYGPFGETIRLTPNANNQSPFRFSTKYTDDESDFLYYGYRYYNPSTGRWLNRDPIGEKGGFNLYRYVGNNPIDNVDPYGLLDYYYSSGSFLYPSGPVPYLEADTALGNVGSGVYNSVPFTYNFLFGGLFNVGTAEGTISGQGGNALRTTVAVVNDGMAVAAVVAPVVVELKCCATAVQAAKQAALVAEARAAALAEALVRRDRALVALRATEEVFAQKMTTLAPALEQAEANFVEAGLQHGLGSAAQAETVAALRVIEAEIDQYRRALRAAEENWQKANEAAKNCGRGR